MRLAVLADIHGNLPALEAVLTDIQRHGVDGFIVAGDLLTGGPQPIETMHLLRSLDAWMIRGNTDNYLLAYDAGDAPGGWHASSQWALMRWSYRHLNQEILDSIASLPEQRVIDLPGTAPIRVVHGSPHHPTEPLFPDRDPLTLRVARKADLLPPDRAPLSLDAVLAQIAEPVLACGHTHIPWQQEQVRGLVFNPGAVCGPLNGDTRAQYALLTWQDHHWSVEHRAIPYDLDWIRTAFRASGLLTEGGALARAFLLSIETGQNVGTYLLAHAHRLAAEAGCEGCDVVPDAIWEQAAATFEWEAYT
jgi:predicted phosphodiesterase